MVILATLAGVALFLIVKAWPAITADAEELPGGEGLVKYIWPLVFGTLVAATIAVVIAVPIAVAVALFISHIAPRRIAQPLSYLIDLLAAIPSVIYGLWGIAVLGPHSVGILRWLEDNLGFIPLFEGPASATGRTMLVAGIVLAVMILPIITAVTRSVFEQTPRRLQEGALALGATRWEMIRLTVLPFGKLGDHQRLDARPRPRARRDDGRRDHALGLRRRHLQPDRLRRTRRRSRRTSRSTSPSPPASTVNTLIASGLVLFAVTLVVNMAARAVINRQMRI